MPYQEYAGVSPRPSTKLHWTLTFLFIAALLTPASARADDCSPAPELWGFNRSVNAIICTSDAIYVGGNFSYVCFSTGSWAPVNAITGQRIASFPRIYGVVHACIPDGAGGWYVGGFFSKVGELARQNAAHILASGAVDPDWNPHISWEPRADYGQVYALALSGRRVYVGGRFTKIGGQKRNCIAELDATTGRATAWNPDAGHYSTVNTLALSKGTLYAGGDFRQLGGQGRNYIAALDTATGRATAWNPNADEPVYTMALAKGTLYAGGAFHHIGGQTRNHIAALDAATGRATAWNPNGDWPAETEYGGEVRALALSGRRVYVGGNFNRIGGQRRNSIAALDAATGLATAWNPDAGNSMVNALAVSGGAVYAGGRFDGIGRQARYNLAAVDATIGLATAWNPNPNRYFNYPVTVLAVSGDTVVIGGQPQFLKGQDRNNIVALNPATGAPTDWNPEADGPVDAMVRSGRIIYVGGRFHNIGGQARNGLAAIDAKTGRATAWNPNPNGSVNTLALSGGTLYAGGLFSKIGGKRRNNLAAISLQTGRASAWSPDPDDTVYALAVSGGTVYAGGVFHQIGGKARNYLAALSAATGLATAWNPNPDWVVRALAVAGRTVYVGGGFSRICGQPRSYLVAIDTTSGRIPAAWKAHFGNVHYSYSIDTVLVSGGTVYAGGRHFNQVIALDATSGKDLPCLSTPKINGYGDEEGNAICAFALWDGMLYFGGDFTSVDDQPRYYIDRLRLTH